MAIYKNDIVDINLETGNIHRSFLSYSIGYGDDDANRFGVRAYRNGTPENIGGTCIGFFIRSTGDTVVIEDGVVSGNEAYVTLPDSCYTVEGQFTLAIKCQGGGVTGTLRIVDGVVSRTSTSTVVDPGTIIPSIEDLLEAIDDAVASIPADYSSLWTSLAPEFDAAAEYDATQYVTYNGNVYRFIKDHSGSWDADDVVAVNVGNELYQLESKLSEKIDAASDLSGYNLYSNGFQLGSYSTAGEIVSSTNRAYCIYADLTRFSVLFFDGSKYSVNYYYVNSDEDLTFVYSPNSWNNSGKIVFSYSSAWEGYGLVVVVKKADNSTITGADLDGMNRNIMAFQFSGVIYNGVVKGLHLASNYKVGFYSVPSYASAVLQAMDDVPADNFLGGYLLNTYIGANEGIMQTLVEYSSGRTFCRTAGSAWYIPNNRPSSTGHNWVAFGDSITNGSYSDSEGHTYNGPTRGWAYRVSRYLRNDIKAFYNCAVRGIGWIDTGNNGETLSDMFALYDGDKTKIDLVTIMLGINDYITATYQLGTVESEENDGTISGAIRYALHYLSANYYNAKIIVISPLNSTKHGSVSTAWSRHLSLTNPKTLQDVSDMVAYWCNYFGIEFIDELTQGFINTYNAENWLGDELHPTDEGQWMLANELNKKIHI